jgi:hypothetical protein
MHSTLDGVFQPVLPDGLLQAGSEISDYHLPAAPLVRSDDDGKA